jgi:ketosteroid isomerase-like protein
MAHPNEELMRGAFAAFMRGDMEALQNTYFAEDIRYHVAGRSQVAGTYEGVGATLGLFARLFELSGGTLSLELHDVVANDDHTVALFTVRAERDGKVLDDNEILVSHATPDGKAAEVWTQSTDVYTSDAFWG